MVGGSCWLFFPTASTEKKSTACFLTKQWVFLNTSLQQLGIYLKDLGKLVPLETGLQEEMSGVFVNRAVICKHFPINPQYHGCFCQLTLTGTPFHMKGSWRSLWSYWHFSQPQKGKWIVNDPHSHFHQALDWPKTEAWPWQPQPLHHVIDLVLSATLNSSIKNLKDLPPILFIATQELHYSHVHTFEHKLSFMISFIPFFRHAIYHWRHYHQNIDPVHTWHKMPLISGGLWNLVHCYKHFPWSPVQQSAWKTSLFISYLITAQWQSHYDIFPWCWSCWFKPFPNLTQLSCFASSQDDMAGIGGGGVQWTWHTGTGRLL